jgi:hypothetical protein
MDSEIPGDLEPFECENGSIANIENCRFSLCPVFVPVERLLVLNPVNPLLPPLDLVDHRHEVLLT